MKTPKDVLPRSQTENPYLAARREWNERYGDYIAQANAWRLTAIMALGVSLICVGGLVALSLQSRLVPYVVEVDKLGQALPVARAEKSNIPDTRIIRAELARFITSVRSVYADAGAERNLINEAYAVLDQNTPGGAFLNGFFKANNPFTRAEIETVTVNVNSVLLLGGNTWRVEWQEDTSSRDGRVISTKSWQANITVNIHTPTQETIILKNPMGIYVTALNWSERL